jgi:hypothetical protein
MKRLAPGDVVITPLTRCRATRPTFSSRTRPASASKADKTQRSVGRSYNVNSTKARSDLDLTFVLLE